MNNKSPITPALQTKTPASAPASISSGHSASDVTPRVRKSPDNRFRCQFRFGWTRISLMNMNLDGAQRTQTEASVFAHCSQCFEAHP
jgi:hypothetical protein